MTEDDAARELSEWKRNAPTGEEAATVILFGIKYADELRRMSYASVARKANISSSHSYGTELGYGVTLAKYVQLKPE